MEQVPNHRVEEVLHRGTWKARQKQRLKIYPVIYMSPTPIQSSLALAGVGL